MLVVTHVSDEVLHKLQLLVFLPQVKILETGRLLPLIVGRWLFVLGDGPQQYRLEGREPFDK